MDLFIEIEGWSTPSDSSLSGSLQTLSTSKGYTPTLSPAESQVQLGMASRRSSQSLKSQSQSGAEQTLTPVMDNSQKDKAQTRKGRKGHSKSRTGCLNCKKARIKCKENRPECDYCAHRDLKCEWPDLQVNQMMSSNALVRSVQTSVPALRTTSGQRPLPTEIKAFLPPVFTMQDFRLFTFFIKEAYPHHPIGNDAVWKHEIPNISHDYDFLLHSMLGLAASELACSTDPTAQMHSTALSHRVKAITALNSSITNGISCYEEGNAMIATCYALLFQSCLLEDGLVEYMTFIRGTLCIGIQMGMRQMRFLFDKIFEQEQMEQVDPVMKEANLIQSEVVQAACRSFEKLRLLCTEKVEIEVYNLLYGIARALITSSRDGYMALRKMYVLFSYTMTQSEFEYYCSPRNEVCRILQAHFVALQLIMSPVTKAEQAPKERETGTKDESMKTVLWIVGIHKNIRPEMRKYCKWTVWVQNEVLAGRLYNGEVSDEALGRLLDT